MQHPLASADLTPVSGSLSRHLILEAGRQRLVDPSPVKGYFFLAACAVGLCGCSGPATVGTASPGALTLFSPDKRVSVAVQTEGALTYSVAVDGRPVLRESRLGLQFRDGPALGTEAVLSRAVRRQADASWENRFGKRRWVRDRHNELRLVLHDKARPGS